jgi:DNA invertase Pin-like site-specific DNA recombinase
MTKTVVLYGRVSSEEQAGADRVSIDQQLAEMHALIERAGWTAATVFIDAENYRATLPPKKGRIVNPSGERSDRPQFLSMLNLVKTGKIDAVVCWRDDRLIRHPRVNVAIEDALDEADRIRREKVQIYDATGAILDRFTMSIKAAVWKEGKTTAAKNESGSVESGPCRQAAGLAVMSGWGTIRSKRSTDVESES